jgi:hypothetical protein
MHYGGPGDPIRCERNADRGDPRRQSGAPPPF